MPRPRKNEPRHEPTPEEIAAQAAELMRQRVEREGSEAAYQRHREKQKRQQQAERVRKMVELITKAKAERKAE